jgi:hypothetical protein
MRTKLKLLFVCAVVLLLGFTPKALALVVGFNPDIHMDIPGVIANDFHIQGRIESGDWGGNWSNPPVLIGHIDGGFPKFSYSITPDLSDPGQNWYIFIADWSGTNYPYCSVIHLGLFFDVDCHNVAVNLVGWWTQNGGIPVPPPPFPPPVNGGSVPIPGFDVQDQPSPMHPQKISLFNHSRDGGGGGSGIYTEIVQMDLVSLTKEELERYLGPIPGAFEELYYNGDQQNLPWVPVANEKGTISEENPQTLLPDSFFDVFLDLSGPIHPVTPITIPPGGFLVARERVRFRDNAGVTDIRWDWMIHGAHESDLGDAPDSSNSFGMPPPLVLMTAYPKGGPAGVIAHYPTVYQMGSPPYGPIHWASWVVAHLGPAVSPEMEADIGPDADPTNNIIPLKDTPDLDNFDDGVQMPLVLPHCQWTTFDYSVFIMPPMPPPMPQTPPLYVNVWFDWNRDGDWDDTLECIKDDVLIPAPEWAVQNQLIVGLPAGLHKITTPPFMPWYPATGDTPPIWMRITLSEQKWFPTAGVLGDGGSGPKYGYLYGETEDYYFVPEIPELDFGDAPEAWTAGFRYPTTLANNGARHIIVPGVCLGAQIDSEQDGQPTLLADGDDIANLDDEDGVTYASAIVPGATVDINIVASTSGALSAWLDYNGDGDWDEADEMVFAGQALVAGENRLQFNVPVTAVPGITTYARLRFTTADTALTYDGLAQDGEVEDYIVQIQEKPPKPPIEHLKWSQPPIEWDPKSKTPVYCGWDELSFKEEWEPPPIWKIVADDFRCIGSMPITSIHWWGSYKGYLYPQPPAVKPIAWRIGFWSNVVPMPSGSVSQPGKLLWQVEVSATRVHEEWAGIDQFPDSPMDTCFQYYVNLTTKEYFWQQKFIDPQSKDDVFWLSIAAVYPPGPLPPNLWGWKTRPWHWMDDAVTFTIQGDFKPGYVPDPSIVRPLEGICGESYDVAFELDTDPNYIKWEQAYTGIRDWPHYEDEESMATVDTVVETVTKWSQKPDLNPVISIDVDATFSQQPAYPPQVLADDFNCITTGPITDIYIWGSWLHDALPDGGPQNVFFTLSIHDDLPVGHPQNPNRYSMPGQLRWMRQFNPGEFDVLLYTEVPEGYYMPCLPMYWAQDHLRCWLYHFKLQPGEFTQTGSTTKPVVYWLDVQAMPIGATNPEVRFGWKASEQHWNDDAVYAVGTEPILVPGPWQNLTYPVGHPYAGRTIDLAFEIVTQKQYEQFNLIRQVADDWKCERRTPVTAAVWWGSYIGYRYEACQCQATTPPPTKPDYFLLSIWTDVPVGPNDKFSHPGTKVWEYKAFDYDEVLVGYDKHPEASPPGQPGGFEPVFRYSVKLPQTSWFRQKDVERVFWLSVVAVYRGPLPVIYPWGWTNHKHVFNDDAAAWEQDLTGMWKWVPLKDKTGVTEDMSFVLFTDPNVCVNCADYNLDDIVDFKDLEVFVNNWLWSGPSGGCNNGDLDCDGDVEFHDFAILASQWLNKCP